MKKLLILIIVLVIFVTGCTNEPEKSKDILTYPSFSSFSSFSFGTFETIKIDWSKFTTATEKPVHQEIMVWIPRTGKKYHLSSICSGMENPSRIPISKARRYGYEPCSKCYS